MRIAKGGAPPQRRVAEHARRGRGLVKVREPTASGSSHLQEIVAGRLASTSATLRRWRRGGRPLKSSQFGLDSADLAVELLLDHGIVVLEKFGDPVGGRRADRGPEVEELLLDHGAVVFDKVGGISRRSADQGLQGQHLCREQLQLSLSVVLARGRGTRSAPPLELSREQGDGPVLRLDKAQGVGEVADHAGHGRVDSSW